MLALLGFELEILCEMFHLLANLGGLAVRRADLTQEEERHRIDDFLAGRPEAQLFHRPSWTRGVEQGTGQEAHYLVAENASGEVVGVLPLSKISSPLFGSALVSAGFAVGGGIVAATDRARESIAAAAWSLAAEERCSTVELRGGSLPSGWSREEGVYAGFLRDLPCGHDAILQSIPRKKRADVRRSLSSGLEIRIGRSAELLDLHYRVYSESVRNLGTPVFPRRLFEAMAHEWGDQADVLVVCAGIQPLAAVFNLYHGDVVHPYWGGGTRAARAVRANDLMYFALMRHASERACARFDFGRSKVGTGAYAFKKNWGFAPRPMVYARRGADRDTNPLSPKHRLPVALWRRLPLRIANGLGPMISRGLG